MDSERGRPSADLHRLAGVDPITLPPHEAHLSAAIDTARWWIENSPDRSIRTAFRLALHELLALLPEWVGR
jgi:hypothetical protein